MNKTEAQKLLMGLLMPLKEHYTPKGAGIIIGATRTHYEYRAQMAEAFLRPLWGLVPYWYGGGRSGGFEGIYRKGLIAGTDPSNPEYWGVCHRGDQCFVEMAAIAYGLILSPEILWEPLTKEQKNHVVTWLWQINENEVWDCNWLYFRVMVNLALKLIGRPYAHERLEQDLQRIESFYIGGGWYRDGDSNHKDYYIPCAMHFYGLFYAKFAEEFDPERSARFKARAEEFAKDFIYWFDDKGEALPYGRSLTYRFVQGAFWSACIWAGLEPFPIGVMKGLVMRNLKKWFEAPITDAAGLLTIGYRYPNLMMAEGYNAPGSPYWGCKTFLFLALPEEHPFWSAEEEPLPALAQTRVMKDADMIVSRIDGAVCAYPAGGCGNYGHGHMIEKYQKFAYSSRFGFNVSAGNLTLEQTAPDSTMCFVYDGMVFPRRRVTDYTILDNCVASTWTPLKGITVETRIYPMETGHKRVHHIKTELPCTVYDSGFSVNPEEPGFRVWQTEQALTAKNNRQYCRISASFGEYTLIRPFPNTNVSYPVTVIPAVRKTLEPGEYELETIVVQQEEK